MNAHDAAQRAVRSLIATDTARIHAGVPPLSSEDLTWQQWHDTLTWRITLAFSQGHGPGANRPDMELLETAAGSLLALMVRLDQAELADPSTGEAA